MICRTRRWSTSALWRCCKSLDILLEVVEVLKKFTLKMREKGDMGDTKPDVETRDTRENRGL